MAMLPTIGRMVLYTLDQNDVSLISARRDVIGGMGNSVSPGDVYAATVVRVFDGTADVVNLQVNLDGNDLYWATSRREGKGPGTWAWPSRQSLH